MASVSAFLFGGLCAQGCDSMTDAHAGTTTVLTASCDYEFPEAEGQFAARFTLPGATRDEMLSAVAVAEGGPNLFGMPELNVGQSGTLALVAYSGEDYDNSVYIPCFIGSAPPDDGRTYRLIVRHTED